MKLALFLDVQPLPAANGPPSSLQQHPSITQWTNQCRRILSHISAMKQPALQPIEFVVVNIHQPIKSTEFSWHPLTRELMQSSAVLKLKRHDPLAEWIGKFLQASGKEASTDVVCPFVEWLQAPVCHEAVCIMLAPYSTSTIKKQISHRQGIWIDTSDVASLQQPATSIVRRIPLNRIERDLKFDMLMECMKSTEQMTSPVAFKAKVPALNVTSPSLLENPTNATLYVMNSYLRFLYGEEPILRYITHWINLKRRLRTKMGPTYVVHVLQHALQELICPSTQVRQVWLVDTIKACGLEPDPMVQRLIASRNAAFIERPAEERRRTTWLQRLNDSSPPSMQLWSRIMMCREIQMQIIMILELLRSINASEIAARKLLDEQIPEINQKKIRDTLCQHLEDATDLLCIQYSCPLDVDDVTLADRWLKIADECRFAERPFLENVVNGPRFVKCLKTVCDLIHSKFSIPFVSPAKPTKSETQSLAVDLQRPAPSSNTTTATQLTGMTLQTKALFYAHKKVVAGAKRRSNDLIDAFKDAVKETKQETQTIKASVFYGKKKKSKAEQPSRKENSNPANILVMDTPIKKSKSK